VEAAYRRAAEPEIVLGMNVLAAEALLTSADAHARLGESEWSRLRNEVDQSLQRVKGKPEIADAVDQTFPVLFALMLLYSICCLSTLTLNNVVGLRNLKDPQRSFGGIRLYGTLGWVAAGLVLGEFLNPISPAPLYLAAASSAVMGVYCFTLPHTPPKGTGGTLRQSLGLPALRLLEYGPFLVFLLCALGLAITQQFYAVYGNMFLVDLGIERAASVQTLAQVGEIITLMVLPFLLSRFGFKGLLALGILLLVMRNGLFALGSKDAVVFAGLPLHGISYACFYVVGAMYVDRLAPSHLRASTQGIVTFVTLGAGTLLGNWCSSSVVEHYSLGASVAWSEVWLVPTYAVAAISLLFLLFFRNGYREQSHKAR
jgi:nucleoside transporter